MTPITIEPNSGVKMAGVKVTDKGFGLGSYIEIIFVGDKLFFGKWQNGKEDSFEIRDTWNEFFIYEEPKPEVEYSDRKWSMEERIERIEGIVTFIANLLKGVEKV